LQYQQHNTDDQTSDGGLVRILVFFSSFSNDFEDLIDPFAYGLPSSQSVA